MRPLKALAPLDLAAAALLKASGSEAEAAAALAASSALQCHHTARLIVAAMYGKGGVFWGGGQCPFRGQQGVGVGVAHPQMARRGCSCNSSRSSSCCAHREGF